MRSLGWVLVAFGLLLTTVGVVFYFAPGPGLALLALGLPPVLVGCLLLRVTRDVQA
jgi:hypothetical protein